MENELPERFRQFAHQKCTGRIGAPSPLYEHLSLEIAADSDPDLLALAANARDEQPTPNLLFAAVQSLLFDVPESPLADYYPSVGTETRPIDDRTYPAFRAFCLEHETEIGDLLSSRRVQTNAVRRSACLLPAFEYVSRRVERTPLALIEIGSSAGLNLLWDQYGYDYGAHGTYGDENAPMQIPCELRGQLDPPLPSDLPPVGSRVGIDLHPLDVRKGADASWLEALVWPEHDQRRTLVSNAVQRARERESPPRVVEGDVLEELATVVDDVAAERPICLYNTYVLYQFSDTQRERLYDLVTDLGESRDIYWLSCEWAMDIATPLIHCYRFEDGVHSGDLLARFHGHGSWLQWLHEDQ